MTYPCEWCGAELTAYYDTRGRIIEPRYCPRPRACRQRAYEARQNLIPGRTRAVTAKRARRRADA